MKFTTLKPVRIYKKLFTAIILILIIFTTGCSGTLFEGLTTEKMAIQDRVFSSDLYIHGGKEVTIASSGDSSNEVWFAPEGAIIFTIGSTMTTVSGDSTTILSPADEGEYKLYIVDADGNIFGPSIATLTVDNTAPVVAIVSPGDSEEVNGSEVISFTNTEITNSQVSVDNINWTNAASGVTTLNNISGFTGSGEGAFILYLRDIDLAGNIGTHSIKLIKDSITPTVAITYAQGSNTAGPFKTGNITITGTYSESIGSIPNISIVQQGTAAITGIAMTDAGSNTYTYVYSIVEDDGSAYVDGLATITLSGTADSAENTSANPTNNTFVTDTTIPSITEVRGNPTSGFYKQDDQITIEVVFDDDINLTGGSGILTLSDSLGNATCSSASTSILTCTITVGAGKTSSDLNYSAIDSLSLEGGVEIKDGAENIASLTLPVTGDGSSLADTSAIVVDTTVPTVSTVTIASNNVSDSSAYAIPGNTVTLTINADEDLGSNPTVTIAGNAATLSGGSQNYTATYVMTSGDTEGTIAFTIDFIDLAGNTGTTITGTTDASSLTFDKTIPVINSSVLDSDNIHIDITFSEGLYNANTGSGALSTADFTGVFTQNGGTATNVTISSVTNTANGALTGGESTIRVVLSVTGTPDGNETIEVHPASGSIFDQKGNAALTSTTTGAIVLNAAGVSNITSGVIDFDNTYIDVTFDEGVWTNSGQSGGLVVADFVKVFSQNSGSATDVTISSVKQNDNIIEGSASALIGGETVVRLFFTVTGTPGGVETLELKAALNAIYSSTNGITPVTNTTTAKLLNDKLSPTVTNVTSSTVDGTYGVDEIISIQVVFSENISVTGTPQLTLETGASDAVLDFASVSGGNTMNFTYTVVTGHASSDLAYGSTGDLALNSGTIKDTSSSANNGALTLPVMGLAGSLSGNKQIVIDAAVPVISTIESQDLDNNGKIDHYKITFNKDMSDTTFPGYVDTNIEGANTTKWLVFNYSNIRIDPTVSGDTDNDSVIYLKFDESTVYDTDLKPDMTTTSVPDFKDLYGNPISQVFTATATEIDKAAPIIVSRTGAEGASLLTLTFSEAVWGAENMPDCGSGGEILTSDLSYTDGNSGSGAAAFSSMDNDCGTDSTITINVNNNFITGDSADSITKVSAAIYDAANNEMADGTTTTLTLATGPTLTGVSVSKYDTVTVTFSAVIKAGSVTGTGECSSGSSCFDIYKIPGLTVTNAVSTGGAGVASASFTLTTSGQAEGTIYTLTVPANSVQRNSDSEPIATIDNTENFTGDGRPLISSTSDSNCSDVYIQYDQNMRDTGENSGDVDFIGDIGSGNYHYQVTGCSGINCTTNYGTLPVDATGGSWDGGTKIGTIVFPGMNASDTYTITIKSVEDINGNSIALGTTTIVNGCNAPDTVTPILDNASAPSDTTVLLTFSEEVDQTTAETAGNYSINGLTVSQAFKQANPQQVILITSTQGGSSYSVVVTGVRDIAAIPNTIVANGVDNIQPFIGAGSSGIPTTFDNELFENPFNDDIPSGQLFVFNDKLHIGPSDSEGSIFEMTYDMGTTSTITLNSIGCGDNTTIKPFTGWTPAGAGGQIQGIDAFYTACVGTGLDPLLTGSACTGTEYTFIGGFLNSGGYYRSVFYSSDTGLERTFTEIGGMDASNNTFRSMSSQIFNGYLYVVSPHRGGYAPRMSRICMISTGCQGASGNSFGAVTAIGGRFITRIGKYGTISNSTSNSSYNTVAVDSMIVYNNDITGINISQLYMANGGRLTDTIALGSARTQVGGVANDGVDGGIVRTTETYSAANMPIDSNCGGSAGNCLSRWEDVSPTDQKWIDYWSIALPWNPDPSANEDWSQLVPSNRIAPSIKAIPYMRTAPNGDLYIIRNACSSVVMQTVNIASANGGNVNNGFVANGSQTCTSGNEIPQLWMLPKNSGNAAPAQAAWTLVAEGRGLGRTDMSGNTGASECNETSTSLTGTLSVTNGSTAVTGSLTLFDTELAKYDAIKIGSVYVNIKSITDSTNLVLADAWTGVTNGTASADKISNKCDGENTHISLLEFNGNYLYLGFDNGTNGLNIWRTNVASLTSGTGPAEGDFSLVSPGFGLGDGSDNSRIWSHLTINDGTTDFLIISTRNGSDPVKIYRTDNN